jgi:predicted nucleic-acid-binding Zn-ribbon protein
MSEWRCPQCGEKVEEQFTECWNCGTAQDGTPDPAFTEKELARELPQLDAQRRELLSGFKCAKCSSDQAEVEVVRVSSGLFAGAVGRMLDFQAKRYLALACKDCGYVELYRR